MDRQLMTIVIKPLTGNTFTLEVAPTDKVRTMKAKIWDAEGVQPNLQRLIFSGKELEDRRTVQDYNVEQESVIHLVVKHIGTMKIHVVTFNAEIFNIYVDGSDTVDDLKSKIKDKTGIHPDRQCLTFCGKKLHDGQQTLNQYEIQVESTVLVIRQPGTMPINIEETSQITSKSFILLVDRMDTVADVKGRIEEKERILVNEQQLIFGGVSLEDSCTVENYGIGKNGTLTLTRIPGDNMQIFVNNLEGKIKTYNVKISDKVESLKAKIHEKELIGIADIRVNFRGKILIDGRKLEEYNIPKESTLHLMMPLQGGGSDSL